MEKLQFLDLSELKPGEEEELANILYNYDYPEAVELPPESPPTWTHHPVPYVVLEPEPLNGEEEEGMTEVEQPVEYPTGAHMIAPQYAQMMAPPASVYVSNLTANVNVHSFIPGAMAYPTAYMPSVDQNRKPRPAKTPTKRSPEVRRTMEPPQATFAQTFPPHYPTIHYPPYYYPLQTLQQPISRSFVGVPPVYPPTATPVYGGYPAAFPQHHMQQPPAEPREENQVPYQEEEEKMEQPDYQQQASEEEDQPVVESVIVENSSFQLAEEDYPEVQEVVIEEVKVEKILTNKAPPANAFKSTPSMTNKPPFPVHGKQKQQLEDGPQFVEPTVDTGPPRKSYAQMAQSDSTATKPLAMIHPTIHNVVSVPGQTLVHSTVEDKPCVTDVQENSSTISFSIPQKLHPDKLILPDYDINLQRLGEFLSSYQLDHKPILLQPRGLTNRSNYCYINAILQALVACPPFYNLMKTIPPSQESKTSKSRTPIIDSMVKFVNEFSPMSLNTRPVGRREKTQAIKEGGGAVSSEVVTGPSFEPSYVYKMLNAMHAAFPVEGRQEDAEEFLSCLLNGLNDEMLEAMKLTEPQTNGLTNGDVTTNGEPTTNGDHDASEQDIEWTEVVNRSNKSVVTRRTEFGRTPLSAIFRGQMRSRVSRAGIENGTTDNVQPFFTLQLDIEKTSCVEKALEMLVGKEEVAGGVCPKTNQEISIFTHTLLEELPLVLMLHLKCFDYKLHTCSKIIKSVDFPIDLKIDNKLCTVKNKMQSKDRQYKLFAVVYHDGKEATKGHYLTDVYHVGYSGWVRYDDATVRPVSLQQVLNPKSPRVPYLLYYRRWDTIGSLDKNR